MRMLYARVHEYDHSYQDDEQHEYQCNKPLLLAGKILHNHFGL